MQENWRAGNLLFRDNRIGKLNDFGKKIGQCAGVTVVVICTIIVIRTTIVVFVFMVIIIIIIFVVMLSIVTFFLHKINNCCTKAFRPSFLRFNFWQTFRLRIVITIDICSCRPNSRLYY